MFKAAISMGNKDFSDLSDAIKALNLKNNGVAPKNDDDVRDFINKNLSGAQAAKLNEVLSDENKMRTILESDAARALFEKFGGGKA